MKNYQIILNKLIFNLTKHYGEKNPINEHVIVQSINKTNRGACFDDLGLSCMGFAHPIFRLRATVNALTDCTTATTHVHRICLDKLINGNKDMELYL